MTLPHYVTLKPPPVARVNIAGYLAKGKPDWR